MSRPIIEVRGVSKRYRLGHIGFTSLREEIERVFSRGRADAAAEAQAFWALRDISFDVMPGEVVGLIGRNGAGKSTLLKILSEITEPTTGEIRLRGHIASLLEVGTGFHPELSGRDNIYLNGATLGMRRAEIARKFDEIVAFAEVDRFLDTPVKRYSSGMYVRLAFAVAAHLEPEILLVDEVLAVGDHAFQQKCLGKMQDVARQGRTIVFVSHNMAAVAGLCSRVVLLHDGAVEMIGPVTEAVSRYLSGHVEDNRFRPPEMPRPGSGAVRIDDFRIAPEMPATGQALRCSLAVKRTAPVPVEVEAAVSISTQEGQAVLQLYSADMGCRVTIDQAEARIELELEALPLAPGRYRVALWLGQGRVPVDWIQDAMTLHVQPGGFEAGAMVQATGFPVVARTRWSAARATIRSTAERRPDAG